MAAALGLYFDKKISNAAYTLFLPVIFFSFEYAFRYNFWSSYIFRVDQIEAYLNGERERFRLYVLNDSAPIIYRVKGQL